MKGKKPTKKRWLKNHTSARKRRLEQSKQHLCAPTCLTVAAAVLITVSVFLGWANNRKLRPSRWQMSSWNPTHHTTNSQRRDILKNKRSYIGRPPSRPVEQYRQFADSIWHVLRQTWFHKWQHQKRTYLVVGSSWILQQGQGRLEHL